MSNFLAIDTSSRYLTVLAVNGEKKVLRHRDDCAMRHSVILMEEIDAAFERMALAQKQQQLYADEQGVDLREYNVNGSLYTELLKEHTYRINEKLFQRLNFGKITIE